MHQAPCLSCLDSCHKLALVPGKLLGLVFPLQQGTLQVDQKMANSLADSGLNDFLDSFLAHPLDFQAKQSSNAFPRSQQVHTPLEREFNMLVRWQLHCLAAQEKTFQP